MTTQTHNPLVARALEDVCAIRDRHPGARPFLEEFGAFDSFAWLFTQMMIESWLAGHKAGKADG